MSLCVRAKAGQLLQPRLLQCLQGVNAIGEALQPGRALQQVGAG